MRQNSEFIWSHKKNQFQIHGKIIQSLNGKKTWLMFIDRHRIIVMRNAIWYHFYNLKTWKIPIEECYYLGVFHVFKLYKWYQIAQSISSIYLTISCLNCKKEEQLLTFFYQFTFLHIFMFFLTSIYPDKSKNKNIKYSEFSAEYTKHQTAFRTNLRIFPPGVAF